MSKFLLLFFLVFASSGCATTPDFESRRAVVASPRGCLGQDLGACLALLKPFMTSLALHNVETQLANLGQTDVNGAPLQNAPKISTFIFGVEFHRDTGDLLPRDVTLHLSPDRKVTQIDMDLSPLTLTAQTNAEYARSKIYDEALLALGARCSMLETPNTLFRFFHNTLKPALATTQQTTEGTLRRRTYFESATPWAKLCDAQVRLERLGSYSESGIKREKNDQDFGKTTLILK